MQYTIYVLSNPINNEIFYVGCTSRELELRLRDHYYKVNEARRGDINWNKRLSYLDQLLPHKAQITEIDRCSEKQKDYFEKFYIDKYFESGHPLTNQTIGGIGGDTFTMNTTDNKIQTGKLISDKLKGTKKPEGFAKNLSEKRKGYGNPQAGKTIHPPLVLESSSLIIIFRNSIEANEYFSNKHTWGNLVSIAKHNKVNDNKRFHLKTYKVDFSTTEIEIKDIVESLLERQGNCYVFDKHTQKITVK